MTNIQPNVVYLSQVFLDPTSAADPLFVDGHLRPQPLDIRYGRSQTLGRVTGTCLRTGRPLIVRGLVRDRRRCVGVLLNLQRHYPLVRLSQFLTPTLRHDLHIMDFGLCEPEILPQMRNRRLLELHLAKRLPEARPRLVSLLPRLHQQCSLGIQLVLQAVQLRPLVLHTPQRDLKRHLRPSWGRSRREGGQDHRSRLRQGRHREVCLRDVHCLRHRLWP
jgi:hypothetical protein